MNGSSAAGLREATEGAGLSPEQVRNAMAYYLDGHQDEVDQRIRRNRDEAESKRPWRQFDDLDAFMAHLKAIGAPTDVSDDDSGLPSDSFGDVTARSRRPNRAVPRASRPA